jgi:hypothetical protein
MKSEKWAKVNDEKLTGHVRISHLILYLMQSYERFFWRGGGVDDVKLSFNFFLFFFGGNGV